MTFADFRGHAFLVKRFIQRLSEVEEVEIVGYKASTSYWHSGIISLQEAWTFCYSLYNHNYELHFLHSLLEEKDEELQLQGFPSICQYLALDSVCLTKLPQVLLNLDFLRWIRIADCSDLVSFPEATLPSHLRSIDIYSCDALKCLPDTWMYCTSLECLSIISCESLMYLTRRQLFPNLKQLVIRRCEDLKTLMQEEDNSLGGSSISATSSFSKSELPATLEHIEIKYCDNLAYLSSGGNNLPKALKYLSLCYCSKLESVVERFHDNTCLKEICISFCDNLQLLPENLQKLDHLEQISVIYCPSLVSFPRGGFPSTNLTDVKIKLCQKLVDLPDNMHQLNHLQQIEIEACSSLVSFPAGGFPSTNLTELIISKCQKLEVLPNDMYQLNHLQKIEILECEKLKGLPNQMQNLTSLRDLRISKCGGMESFPGDGFPINLTTLCIIDTPKICERLFQWGLHRLSSLRKLCMKGCPAVVSFPPQERGILLPTSLIILDIRDFPDLKRLSSDIQSLISLEELNLENCPKLKSFPEKGLPLSLLKLRSYGCPLLKQNCEKHKGRYWPMIAYIPEINMDYRLWDTKMTIIFSRCSPVDIEKLSNTCCGIQKVWRLARLNECAPDVRNNEQFVKIMASSYHSLEFIRRRT
ncbi:hypothetical protein EZV62_018880 [Acer yangbiense]|uniref:Disease resistance protein At3g14460 n=1 Tax=Acer yangbiense TaxID=1000413 RepID=A0A5C7H9K0_9ROSI|nr:hypothetical protein EZV62_018880 [Acer yangbiense]